MGLYRRNKVYWMSYQVPGKGQIRESTGKETKRDADDELRRVLNDIEAGRWGRQEISFSDFWEERYKVKFAKERDPYSMLHLKPVFGDLIMTKISIDDVEDYIDDRLLEGAKHSTIHKEFTLGRRMFNIARKRFKLVSENPFSDAGFPSYDNARERYLSIGEEQALLAVATPDYLWDVIVFALDTGCRRGEILKAITVHSINTQLRTIIVQASKGGAKKTLHMTDRVYEIVRRRLKVINISGKLFDIAEGALKDAFQRAVKKAKLIDFHFHDCRHTFASRLVQAGVDLYRVQKLMGHRSIKMTERYAHLAPENLSDSINALERYHKSITLAENEDLSKTRKSSIM